MQRLLHEGMDAGLCGFSIQRLGRNSTQADFDGTPDGDRHHGRRGHPRPGRGARRARRGLHPDHPGHRPHQGRPGVRGEAGRAVAKRPVIHNAIAPTRRNPDPHRKSLRWLEKCWDQGLPVYGQAAIGRAGFAFTLENWNLYDFSKAWRALTTGTHEEKLAKMADPELRAAMVEAETRNTPATASCAPASAARSRSSSCSAVPGRPELEHYIGRSLKDIAAEEGRHPGEVMLDLSLATDLQAEFLGPDKGSNADFMGEIMNDSPYTVPGVSDGGAHTKFFTGGAWTTDMLRWLVRDEGKVTLEEAHYRMSALAAHAAGFRDRGVLREGAAADVVVYDMEELDIEPQVGRRGRPRPARWRVAPGPAGQGLQAHHRQRRGDLRRRRVHRRHARQAPPPRPRLNDREGGRPRGRPPSSRQRQATAQRDLERRTGVGMISEDELRRAGPQLVRGELGPRHHRPGVVPADDDRPLGLPELAGALVGTRPAHAAGQGRAGGAPPGRARSARRRASARRCCRTCSSPTAPTSRPNGTCGAWRRGLDHLPDALRARRRVRPRRRPHPGRA